MDNFGKNIADNVALIADNCETNKALARLCEEPLIGCHSHRLALAVKEYLKPHDKLISKVNALMGKLRTPKIAAELRKHSPLRPFQFGITRWLSVMQMFERYLVLKEHIVQIEGVLELLLSPVEDNQAKELNKALIPMKSVTLALQRNEMDMASARLLFDELLRQTEELDVKRKYIHQNCDIASNKDFENGTVKILSGEENALTVGEQLACSE